MQYVKINYKRFVISVDYEEMMQGYTDVAERFKHAVSSRD